MNGLSWLMYCAEFLPILSIPMKTTSFHQITLIYQQVPQIPDFSSFHPLDSLYTFQVVSMYIFMIPPITSTCSKSSWSSRIRSLWRIWYTVNSEQSIRASTSLKKSHSMYLWQRWINMARYDTSHLSVCRSLHEFASAFCIPKTLVHIGIRSWLYDVRLSRKPDRLNNMHIDKLVELNVVVYFPFNWVFLKVGR